MTNTIIPGPAVDCQEGCEPGTQAVSAAERKAETCPECGGYAEAVEVTICPNGDCGSEDHHYGLIGPEGKGIHTASVAA